MNFNNKKSWSHKSDSKRFVRTYHDLKRVTFVQSAVASRIKMVIEIDDRLHHLSLELNEAKTLLAELTESVAKVEAHFKRQTESVEAPQSQHFVDVDFNY